VFTEQKINKPPAPTQHTATHCHTLPHTATHCHTLPHTATHCRGPEGPIGQRAANLPRRRARAQTATRLANVSGGICSAIRTRWHHDFFGWRRSRASWLPGLRGLLGPVKRQCACRSSGTSHPGIRADADRGLLASGFRLDKNRYTLSNQQPLRLMWFWFAACA